MNFGFKVQILEKSGQRSKYFIDVKMGQIQHCVLIIPFSLVATSSWKVIISSTSRFFSQKGQSISPMSYSCCTVLIWPSSFWSPSCCQKQNRNFIVIHIKVIYKSLFKLWNPRQKESKQLQKPFQQIMDAFFFTWHAWFSPCYARKTRLNMAVPITLTTKKTCYP